MLRNDSLTYLGVEERLRGVLGICGRHEVDETVAKLSTSWGQTLLHGIVQQLAMSWHDEEVKSTLFVFMKNLIQHGADLNAYSVYVGTPLILFPRRYPVPDRYDGLLQLWLQILSGTEVNLSFCEQTEHRISKSDLCSLPSIVYESYMC